MLLRVWRSTRVIHAVCSFIKTSDSPATCRLSSMFMQNQKDLKFDFNWVWDENMRRSTTACMTGPSNWTCPGKQTKEKHWFIDWSVSSSATVGGVMHLLTAGYYRAAFGWLVTSQRKLRSLYDVSNTQQSEPDSFAEQRILFWILFIVRSFLSFTVNQLLYVQAVGEFGESAQSSYGPLMSLNELGQNPRFKLSPWFWKFSHLMVGNSLLPHTKRSF